MKKAVQLMVLVPFLAAMTWSFQLSADYEIERNADGTISITVTIENGNPEFVLMLYDKAPWQEGQVIENKMNVKENVVTFPGLDNRDYFLLIQDSDKNITSLTISVSAEGSN
jgi:hypothetical protein